MEFCAATGLDPPDNDLQVIEMWPLGLLPAWLTRRRVVEPMRRHTAGTLLVSNNLLQRGTLVWSFACNMPHPAAGKCSGS